MTTEVTFTTVSVANVVVYVDENGKPLTTSTIAQPTMVQSTPAETTLTTTRTFEIVRASPTAAAELGVEPGALSDVPAPTISKTRTSESTPAVSSTSQAASTLDIATQAVTTATSSPQAESTSDRAAEGTTSSAVESSVAFTVASSYIAPNSSPAPSTPSDSPGPEKAADGSAFPIGITFDAFKQNACKSEQEITDQWQKMKSYGVVRIYGMACNLIPIAVKLAHANNQKIMAGIWLSSGESGEDIETVVKALGKAVQDHAGGKWDVVALVSVENERVNDREFTASHVVDATGRARQALRFAGYNGPVGAVETVPATLDNPAICEASDVAFVNVHSFFDSNCNAEGTGQFVKDQVARVKEKCGGKRVVVTEAGWPHTGDSHDNAVPSRANQKKAIDSLLATFKNDLFLFNAFDSLWKSDWAGTFNAERYWGILE